MRTYILAACALMAPVMTVGCMESEVTQSTTDPRLHVLDEIPNLIMQVHPDSLQFPGGRNEPLLAIPAGDLVASSRDQGFVREVVSTVDKNGLLVMQTKEAALSDALVTGGAPPDLPTPPIPSPEGLAGGFSFSNFYLLSGSINARVVEGAIAFAPEINIDLRMKDRAIDLFRATAKGTITGKLVFEVAANVSATKNIEKVVWESPKQYFVQWIGPVPVVETVSVVASVGIDVSATGAGSVTVGGAFTGSIEAGAVFDGQWRPVGAQNLQFVPTVTANGSANLKVHAYCTTTLKVDFYGIAGPYIAITPSLSLEGNSNGQFIKTFGATGYFGASGNIANVQVPSFGQQLFSYSQQF